MIVLDTHVWVWWVHGNASLSSGHRRIIDETIASNESVGLSVFSCWEVAMLVSKARIELSQPVNTWMDHATSVSGLVVLAITPDIAVASTQLPGDIHGDPADRIIVATARSFGCPLLTDDQKLIAYPHVQTPQP